MAPLCGGAGRAPVRAAGWWLTLEGGYDLDVLACGVANTCHALLGDRAPEPDPLGPCPSGPSSPVDDVLRSVRRVCRVWGYFEKKETPPGLTVPLPRTAVLYSFDI